MGSAWRCGVLSRSTSSAIRLSWIARNLKRTNDPIGESAARPRERLQLFEYPFGVPPHREHLILRQIDLHIRQVREKAAKTETAILGDHAPRRRRYEFDMHKVWRKAARAVLEPLMRKWVSDARMPQPLAAKLQRQAK
jgi:hypothetical protein